MIVSGRELVLQQGFIQALLELEQWAGQKDARRGRALVKRLVDFASDTVAPFPFAFPAYQLPAAPSRALRRAIMARQYAVVYEVSDSEIVFVYAYSTYRNPDFIELPDTA